MADPSAELDAFFDRLADEPDSDAVRAVFADWLDESGRSEQAAWLRLETAHRRDTLDLEQRQRFVDLDKSVDPAFRARVSRTTVDACSRRTQQMVFEYACPERWEAMRTTDDPRRRHCEICAKDVHFVDTVSDARLAARKGHCVAITAGAVRYPGDLVLQPPPPLAGVPRRVDPPDTPVGPVLSGAPLHYDDRMPEPPKPSWWRRLLGWS